MKKILNNVPKIVQQKSSHNTGKQEAVPSPANNSPAATRQKRNEFYDSTATTATTAAFAVEVNNQSQKKIKNLHFFV